MRGEVELFFGSFSGDRKVLSLEPDRLCDEFTGEGIERRGQQAWLAASECEAHEVGILTDRDLKLAGENGRGFARRYDVEADLLVTREQLGGGLPHEAHGPADRIANRAPFNQQIFLAACLGRTGQRVAASCDRQEVRTGLQRVRGIEIANDKGVAG